MLDKIYDNLNECIDETFKLSSLYANEGVSKDIGGPFGSGIIQIIDGKYKIIAIARNTVISDKDATCHAEINVIRNASKILNKFDLSDCILVTTSKSCPMCISAACWARIKTVYYSLDYDLATTNGFKDNRILEYLQDNNTQLITENRKHSDYTTIPFETWEHKQDKIDY